MKKDLKVLQICHKMPNPPNDGGSQAIHNLTRGFLENNVEVKILAINPTRNYIDISDLPSDYLDATKFEAVKVDTRIKPFNLLMNLMRKESYFIERFRSKRFEKKLTEILINNHFDIIQLEHLYLFLFVDLIRKNSKARIIFRPQNVEYFIWERYLKNLKNPIRKIFIKVATKRLKRFERNITSKADGIITLTKDDAHIFKIFTEGMPVIDVPLGYDFENIIGYNYKEQYDDFPVFYHLGSMDWLPNEEAVRWFIDKVTELVIKRMPDIRIHFAGRNMQDYFLKKKSKNLLIEGEVANAIDYQRDKAIMIVPLLSGSGIRAKIVEGMALGKTIITTTIGAQGIKYEDGKNLLIADTAHDFLEQMTKCYQSSDICKAIGLSAQKLASEEYHYISKAKEIQNFYELILMKNEI